jgi:hypothetical protein
MPASSEIRFKIGGDTTALSKEFAALPAKAAAAGAAAGKAYAGRMTAATTAAPGGFARDINSVLDRKFGFKDAIKGILQGIGIGSVEAISQAIVRPFELGYERAKDMLGVTTRLREITTAEITAGAGRNVILRETKREINDLNVDISMQRQLIDDLNSNPLTFTNPTSLGLLREAEKELGNLQVRQAELNSKLTTEDKIREKTSREVARQQNLLEDLNQAELQNAGERVKLQIRLNALIAEYNRLAKRGDAPTAAADANVGKQFEIQRQLAILDKQAREQGSATLSAIGQSVAGTRTGGRSEAQRLADRGASRLSAAQQAAMSGGSPAYIAALTRTGNADFRTVGAAVRKATSKVDKADANDLGGQLITANETLKKIEKNLAPSKVAPR